MASRLLHVFQNVLVKRQRHTSFLSVRNSKVISLILLSDCVLFLHVTFIYDFILYTLQYVTRISPT